VLNFKTTKFLISSLDKATYNAKYLIIFQPFIYLLNFENQGRGAWDCKSQWQK